MKAIKRANWTHSMNKIRLQRFFSQASLSYFDFPAPPKVYSLSEMGLRSPFPGCDFAACQPFKLFPKSTLKAIQNELCQVCFLFYFKLKF